MLALTLLITALVVAAAAPAASAQSRPPFRIVQLGDSYASGEGAPDVPGQHNDRSGALIGNPDVWDAGLLGAAAASADECHRSPKAGTAVAAKRLAAEFAGVDVQFRSFACSGSQIAAGLLETYRFRSFDTGRPSRGHTVEPQLRSLHDYQRDELSGGTIHAAVVGIGGNDANFKDIVKRCFNLGFIPKCDNQATIDIFREGFNRLPGRFGRLATALRAEGEPPHAFRAPKRVFLTGYPNFARGAGNVPCDNDREDDNLVDNLARQESIFVGEEVFEPLTALLEQQGQRPAWTYVDVDQRFDGHGICAPPGQNWINTSHEALARQGEDSSSATVGGVNVAVSSGFAHPNYDGFAQGYGEPVYQALRKQLLQTFTPNVETRATPIARETDAAGRTVVRLRLDSSAPVPLATYPRLFVLNENGSFLQPVQRGALNATEMAVTLDSPPPARFLVRAATCGEVLRSHASGGCPPPGPVRQVSLVAPPLPTVVAVVPGRPQSALAGDGTPALTVIWAHDGSPDLRNFAIAVTGGGTTVVREAGSLLRGAVIDGLREGVTYTVQVVACADFDCTRPSLQPKTGTASTNPNDVQVATVTPPIGLAAVSPRRLRARTGRPVRLQASWEHPLNWNQLARVELRLRDGDRVLGRVTFRRDAGRRFTAHGAVDLVRTPADPRPGLLARRVTFPLTLRLGRQLAGRRLAIDIAAADGFGKRQTTRGVATLRIQGSKR